MDGAPDRPDLPPSRPMPAANPAPPSATRGQARREDARSAKVLRSMASTAAPVPPTRARAMSRQGVEGQHTPLLRPRAAVSRRRRRRCRIPCSTGSSGSSTVRNRLKPRASRPTAASRDHRPTRVAAPTASSPRAMATPRGTATCWRCATKRVDGADPRRRGQLGLDRRRVRGVEEPRVGELLKAGEDEGAPRKARNGSSAHPAMRWPRPEARPPGSASPRRRGRGAGRSLRPVGRWRDKTHHPLAAGTLRGGAPGVPGHTLRTAPPGHRHSAAMGRGPERDLARSGRNGLERRTPLDSWSGYGRDDIPAYGDGGAGRRTPAILVAGRMNAVPAPPYPLVGTLGSH